MSSIPNQFRDRLSPLRSNCEFESTMEREKARCTLCKRIYERQAKAIYGTKNKDMIKIIDIKLTEHTGSDLPIDVISIILSKLPLKSLLRCRTVSKTWNLLTRNSQFMYSYHLNHPCLFAFPSFKVVLGLTYLCLFDENHIITRIPFNPNLRGMNYCVLDSCKGFLLLGSRTGGFIIYNPITTETIDIPSPPKDVRTRAVLAFDAKTNKYKLVRFNYIFTLGGESSWRKLTSPYDKLRSGILGLPVFIDEKIYWPHLFDYVVISFDICNEKYTTIKFPHEATSLEDIDLPYYLVEYENKLHFTVFNRQDQRVKIWSLAEEDNWSHQATCSMNNLLSNHYCKHHKYLVVTKVGNDSFLLLYVSDKRNLEHDKYDDWFGLDRAWWKRPIIYTPKSGGRTINFPVNPIEFFGNFSMLRFIPNLASFYGSK